MMNANSNVQFQEIDFHTLYNDRFSRLADDALRAGVVVNFLNINGLHNKPNYQKILDALSEGDKSPVKGGGVSLSDIHH